MRKKKLLIKKADITKQIPLSKIKIEVKQEIIDKVEGSTNATNKDISLKYEHLQSKNNIIKNESVKNEDLDIEDLKMPLHEGSTEIDKLKLPWMLHLENIKVS